MGVEQIAEADLLAVTLFAKRQSPRHAVGGLVPPLGGKPFV